MIYPLSGTTLFIFLLIVCFPDDALAFGNYVYLQVQITILDAYMFLRSYFMYRRLRKDGVDFPFKYTSIRNRNR
jgi:hypothetical protein